MKTTSLNFFAILVVCTLLFGFSNKEMEVSNTKPLSCGVNLQQCGPFRISGPAYVNRSQNTTWTFSVSGSPRNCFVWYFNGGLAGTGNSVNVLIGPYTDTNTITVLDQANCSPAGAGYACGGAVYQFCY
jgi:hypothetical protein